MKRDNNRVNANGNTVGTVGANSNNNNDDYDNEEEDDEDEELPVVTLKNEDKIKVIKGIVLLFLFSSVVIYSLIYCNVPMRNLNILFEAEKGSEGDDNGNSHSGIKYKVISRYVHKNTIQLMIQDSKVTTANDNNFPLSAIFTFSKNRVRIRISQKGIDEYEIPLSLFTSNDLGLKSIGAIEHISESNIGIHINTNPFGFKLFRKRTNETLFNTITDNKLTDTTFKYNTTYKQISTSLCPNHLTFGFYSNSSFRVQDGEYPFWSNWGIDIRDKSLLSIPNFISGNRQSRNFFGSFMLSSAPMNTVLKDNVITYKIYSGIIDLIILNGPKPRDIIIQLQKTFGMPFVPSLSSLNWQGNIIIDKETEATKVINAIKQVDYSSLLFPIKEIWIDDVYNTLLMTNNSIIDSDKGIEFIKYHKPILDMTSDDFNDAGESNVCLRKDNIPLIIADSKQRYCLIDQFNPNTTAFYTKHYNTNKHNLVLQLFQYCGRDDDNIVFFVPFSDNEYTIPLNSKFYDNSTLLNMHNIYSLKHAQNLFNMISRKGDRPLIFSQNTFLGSSQYTGKWLGYFDNSWKGLKEAIKNTLRFNLLGNFGLIHEASGYHTFKGNGPDNEVNGELFVRWIQFSSVSSFSRINNFESIPFLQQKYKESIIQSIQLREMLSLYIYSTMIRNSYEGGSILFPMFAYFMGNTNSNTGDDSPTDDNLFKFEYQFMIGPNIMACPIVEPNESSRATYFPNEIFYDFYTGQLVNKDMEQITLLKEELNKLPLFTRGGFITPIQVPPKDKLILIEDMRMYPIKLIVSLDENYQSQGRLFIDDGISMDDNYVKIEFVCLYNANDKELKLMFQFVENDYKVPKEFYGFFNEISFYGLGMKPTAIQYINDETTIELITKDNDTGDEMVYNAQLKVFDIKLKSINPMKVNSYKPYHIILKDIFL